VTPVDDFTLLVGPRQQLSGREWTRARHTR
jgi:hypothetical protein